jgi:hypothetical protein
VTGAARASDSVRDIRRIIEGLVVNSLNHACWLHGPVRARPMERRGMIYDRTGRLLTNAVHEITLRPGKSSAAIQSARSAKSIEPNSQAMAAPRLCASTKPGASAGRTPANVSVNARATVMAGLANEVEAVHQ